MREHEGSGPGSFNPTPLRTTRTYYYPNDAAGTWVIDKPAYTRVYTGSEASLVSEERFYYDNNASYTAAPSLGRLTKDERVPVVGGVPTGNTVARTNGYYANGNLNWSQDENGHRTTTYYDSWFSAYPVCVQDVLAHKTKTYYLGVPGDGTCATAFGSLTFSGNQFGQVERTEDPNGAINTYAYDGLGRPTQVTLAPDGTGTPTKLLDYRAFGGMGSGQPFWVHARSATRVKVMVTGTAGPISTGLGASCRPSKRWTGTST